MKYRRLGTGPSLFMLHGFCGSSASWGDSFGLLAEEFDVIAPDWPGYGGSRTLSPCTSILAFADALIGLADKLGLKRFSLLGHSVGSFVVQQLMVSHPDRVEAAVLYGSGLRVDGSRRFESLEQTIERMRNESVVETTRRVARSWFVDGERAPSWAVAVAAGAGMTLEAGIATLEAGARHDLSGELAAAAIPALVISGDQERTFPPPMAVALAQTLPQGQLCILPKCAHAAHLERPAIFHAIVRRFLLESGETGSDAG